MTDEDTFTYNRTVLARNLRAIVERLDHNTIPHRVTWARSEKTATIHVKPERQRRLDKFVDTLDK